MNWNDQQLSAIDSIVEFIKAPFDANDPVGWALTIIGHAGTGKTTLVQEAIRRAANLPRPNQEPLSICVTAPTNKATGVLKEFGARVGVNVDARTIFSLLGLVVGATDETKRVFQGGEGDFMVYDVVVIDEGSMVGTFLMDKVSESALKYGVKVIFMGDHCQLNPVKEGQSRVFNSVEVPKQFKLTKIMRQDEGSPIRELIGQVRNLAESGKSVPLVQSKFTENEDGVHVIVGEDFYTTMIHQFNTPEYAQDPTLCRALAWRNDEVDYMNKRIREHIYGKNCPRYVVGETLCILSTVTNVDNIPVIFTDDECKILSIGEAFVTDKEDNETVPNSFPRYKVYVLTVRTPDGKECKVYPIHEDSERDMNNRLNTLSKRANRKVTPWKMFWSFHDKFHKVRPAYAMTVHKSQGQTFQTVFFNVRDVAGNGNAKERARLSYVACSRATTNLVINKPRIS